MRDPTLCGVISTGRYNEDVRLDRRISSDPQPTYRAPPGLQRLPAVLVADRESPDRERLESFVQRGYSDAFGAHLRSHYPVIVGLMDAAFEVVAAAGIRFASSEPLFLERYLGQPVEAALRPIYGDSIERREIVEIGSFAADGPARALEFFEVLAGLLSPAEGRLYGVATVTPRIGAMLRRSGFTLTQIASADPASVGDAARDWGSYYESGPSVLAGEISMPDSVAHPRRRQSRACSVVARREDQ